MRVRVGSLLIAVVMAAGGLAGCGAAIGPGEADAGFEFFGDDLGLVPGPSRDGSVALDAAGADAGHVDAGRLDAGRVDSGAAGGGHVDAGHVDAGHADAGAPMADPPPAALVRCLDAVPYVEGHCKSVVVRGWKHPAKACTYGSPVGPVSVTVADPSASQAAAWIVDSARAFPATAHLEKADPAAFLRATQVMATYLMLTSGRIFALGGDVGEDMNNGAGYVLYPYVDGIPSNCRTGEPHCFCRVINITRGIFCDWRAHLGAETVAACRARLGYGNGPDADWTRECLSAHDAAWTSTENEHFRAFLWWALHDAGLGAGAGGAAVVKGLEAEWGVSERTVTAFCK